MIQFELWSMVFEPVVEREQKVPFTWETIISCSRGQLDENSTATDIREWLDRHKLTE